MMDRAHLNITQLAIIEDQDGEGEDWLIERAEDGICADDLAATLQQYGVVLAPHVAVYILTKILRCARLCTRVVACGTSDIRGSRWS